MPPLSIFKKISYLLVIILGVISMYGADFQKSVYAQYSDMDAVSSSVQQVDVGSDSSFWETLFKPILAVANVLDAANNFFRSLFGFNSPSSDILITNNESESILKPETPQSPPVVSPIPAQYIFADTDLSGDVPVTNISSNTQTPVVQNLTVNGISEADVDRKIAYALTNFIQPSSVIQLVQPDPAVYVTREFFTRQIDAVFDSMRKSISNSIEDIESDDSDLSFTNSVFVNPTANTLTLTTPLSISSGGTGISTAPSYGQVLLGNVSGGYDLVATSSLGITSGSSGTVTSVGLTVPTGLTVSGSPISTSGTFAVSLDSGYVIPLSASTTNWNDFYDTPSSRITAGDGLEWSANTLENTGVLSLGGLTGDISTSSLGISGSKWTANGSDISYVEGNVGIGTDSPSYMLDISGDINIAAESVMRYNGSRIITASTTLSNYFFGRDAGNLTTTGTNGLGRNTGIGYQALTNLTTAYDNTAVGFSSLRSNTSGALNSVLGKEAMRSNTIGSSNTAIGADALWTNTVGSYNTAIGEGALANATNATNTTAVGYLAGGGAVGSQQNNSFFGYRSGNSITSGSSNTFLGYQSGYNMTTGSSNIVIGYNVTAPSNTGSQQLNIGNLIYGTSIYNGASVSSTAVNGRVGIGTASPTNTLSVLSTTQPQFRLSYDANNYFTAGVGSTGGTSLSFTGASSALMMGFAQPASVSTNTGTSATTSLRIIGATGGNTSYTGFAFAGDGGALSLIGGTGGSPTAAGGSYRSGGTGGTVLISGGIGGNVAVNDIGPRQNQGGTGGTLTLQGGEGGIASGTGGVGNFNGSGGSLNLFGGSGLHGGDIFIAGGYSSSAVNAGDVYLGATSTVATQGKVFFGTPTFNGSWDYSKQGLFDPSTGSFGIGLTTFSVFGTGTEFLWDNTTKRLGIGTSSPFAKLSVAGDSYIGGNLIATGTLTVTGTGTSTFANGIDIIGGCFAVAGACIGGSSGSGTVGSGTTGQFGYYAANGTSLTATSSIVLANNGNVGIGTTSPFAKLSVVGDTGSVGVNGGGIAFITGNGGTGTSVAAGRGGDFILTTGSSGSTNFTGTGNRAGNITFLAGSSPDISGEDGGTGGSLSFTAGNGGCGDLSCGLGGGITFATGHIGGVYSPLVMNTSGGNVGIGTTSPLAKLSVRGEGTGTGVAFQVTNSSNTVNVSLLDNGKVGFRTLESASASTLCYTTSGGLNYLSTCSSSQRYKDNIADLEIDPEKVLALRPVEFTWKNTGEKDLGFIAEEVAETIPELVFYKDGQIEGVKYNQIVAYIIGVLKVMRQEINELKSLAANSLASIKNLFVDDITVGTEEKPSGITLYDDVTHEPYCLKISNGNVKTIPGICGSADDDTNDESNSDADENDSDEEVNDTNEESTLNEDHVMDDDEDATEEADSEDTDQISDGTDVEVEENKETTDDIADGTIQEEADSNTETTNSTDTTGNEFETEDSESEQNQSETNEETIDESVSEDEDSEPQQSESESQESAESSSAEASDVGSQ